MLNYYDEILKKLKNDKEVKNFLASKRTIREKLVFSEYIKTRADVIGSCNSEEQARKNCLQDKEEVSIALSWGYPEELEIFEGFIELVEGGYINIDTLELTLETWLEHDFNRQYILGVYEGIKALSFRTLEQITKQNLVFGVLRNIKNEKR